MKKKIALFFVLIIIALLLVRFVKFESVDDYQNSQTEQTKTESEAVTLSISCNTILNNMDKLDDALKKGDYVPEDGVILEKCDISIKEGDTVFDCLSRAVKEYGIQMEYQGGTENAYGSVYIEGIAYLYEFSCGPLSGWMYRVNGEVPEVGCNLYSVSPGDNIEWLYTCELGKDL